MASMALISCSSTPSQKKLSQKEGRVQEYAPQSKSEGKGLCIEKKNVRSGREVMIDVLKEKAATFATQEGVAVIRTSLPVKKPAGKRIQTRYGVEVGIRRPFGEKS